MSAKASPKLVEYLEDLKSDEQKRRISAVKHLNLIAEAFGPEKTLSTLLPFLREYENDDEEVLIELAKQLELLGHIFNHSVAQVVEIIPYYSIVLSYEDISVINEGMMSLKRLVVRYSLKHEALAALAKDLICMGSPKAMISTIRIFSELNKYISKKHIDTVRKTIEDNINSTSCIVRKETAVALRYLLSADDEYLHIAISGLKALFADTQDTVKVHALESLCKQKFNKHVAQAIVPLVLDPLVKKSWRLRYVIASHVLRLLEHSTLRAQLIDTYVSLLLDNELEVAAKAIASLKKASKNLTSDEILDKIMPAFKIIAASNNVDLKGAVAGSVLYLAPAIGKTQSNEHIKEVLVSLLKDESSHIRVELLKNHEPLASVMSLSSLVNILNPVLKQLLADKDWRIRAQGVMALERYLIKLGEVYCSSDSVLDDLKANLRDRVFAVRQAALNLMYGLSEKFGQKWTEKYALTVITSFAKNANYLMRLNYVLGLRLLFKLMSPQVLKDEAETIARLCSDKVPNVRYQAIMNLLLFYEHTEDSDTERLLIGIAKDLDKDQDSDVKSVIGLLNAAADIKTCVRTIILKKA